MNPIKEIKDKLKENHEKEYSELFLQIHNSILEKFSKFSPIESNFFTDGYFIFYHGENSVCHFKLKKYPEWKFGIWLDYIEDKENPHKDYINAEVFCQLERFIDKFKPSRSYFLSEIRFYKDFDNQGEELETFKFEVDNYDINPFNLIWKNPYLAMYRELYSANLNEKFVRPIKAYFAVKKSFLEDTLEERKKIHANKYFIRKLTKWFKKIAKNFGEFEFEIGDNGENVLPRFHPVLTIHQGFTDRELEDFEHSYNKYKNKLRKKFGENAWRYDSFGWIEWSEFTEEKEN